MSYTSLLATSRRTFIGISNQQTPSKIRSVAKRSQIQRNISPKNCFYQNSRLSYSFRKYSFRGLKFVPQIISQKLNVQTSTTEMVSTDLLWEKVLQANERAQNLGAVYSIETKPEIITDASTGVQFVVRVSTALKDKPKKVTAKAELPKKEWLNPFLPYDEDLFVCQLPPSHVLLLNKFNVVDHHLLVVTSEFEQQTDPINERDFAAVWRVLAAFPEPGGLAFYNCGDASGHSQPHKHVQLVPLPFDPQTQAPAPFHPLIMKAAADLGLDEEVESSGIQFRVPSLKFKHTCCLLGPPDKVDASKLERWFASMLESVRTDSDSWNLVMTRDWIMMVPRLSERSGDVALNALGYAGTLLVRSKTEMNQVKERGPMTILEEVGKEF